MDFWDGGSRASVGRIPSRGLPSCRAEEPCHFREALEQTHGLPIVRLAIGETSFNLCFPDGWELDLMVVADDQGLSALRVFWELW